jgi:hypothetical protein
MELAGHIPDDLATHLGSVGELERRMLETLALEEFQRGHLTKAELRRLLGFGSRPALDAFLVAHEVFGTYTEEDLMRDRQDLQRLGL